MQTHRQQTRLMVLDIDSTLIQNEMIDELAVERGVYEEVAQITRKAMEGAMDFNESLIIRCNMLAGLTLSDVHRVCERIKLMPGAEDLIETLKKQGCKVALISGGFSFVADRLKEKLGIHYAFANVLEMNQGVLTGRVLPPIVNAQRKADLLCEIAQKECIELDHVVAVGDGANDLLMLKKAGLGIAFNAKPIVREQVRFAINQRDMRGILSLLEPM